MFCCVRIIPQGGQLEYVRVGRIQKVCGRRRPSAVDDHAFLLLSGVGPTYLLDMVSISNGGYVLSGPKMSFVGSKQV